MGNIHKQLEKLNHYINLLSLVLLIAALATIPVTYFSLKGTFKTTYLVFLLLVALSLLD